MLRKILYCALILGSFVYAKTLEEIRNDGVLRVGVWEINHLLVRLKMALMKALK